MNNDQQSEDSSTRKPEAENSQPEESSTPEVAPSSQEEPSQTEDASEPTSESETSKPESAPAPVAAASADSGISKDSLNLGMLCHLLAFSSIIAPGVGQILGPLIIWLMKKDEDAYVDEQGKESLNFQISVSIYGFVLALTMVTVILIPISIFLLVLLALADIVLVIIGAIKASKGEPWKYPLTIRLIK